MGTALIIVVALIDQHNVGEFFLDWPISLTSRLFEIAVVLLRLDHVASRIVNANHSIMRSALKLRVADCVRYTVLILIAVA
jgi:hypothetical protein